MKTFRGTVATLAAVTLGLGVVGCADDDQDVEPDADQGDDAPAVPDQDDDNDDAVDAGEPDDSDLEDESEGDEADSGSEGNGGGEDEADDNDDASEDDESESESSSGDFLVEVEGQGPYGLYASEVPAGDAQEVDGKLIIGPGSCFSVTDDSQPQLVVFGEDAEFVLREGQPSVTTDDLGTVNVGERFSFSAVEVPQSEVGGIPQQCTQGAADEVLVLE